ncbi:Uncharacterised protein [Mycobacterium tuberculosis]|nr:Uncharacterised protein [Mycobacterium tuberculosis]
MPLFCSAVMVVRAGPTAPRPYTNGAGAVSDPESKTTCWVSGSNDPLSVIVTGPNGVGRLAG